MRTSCRRSLALFALFFFPRRRSKKFMLFPPCQPLNPIPQAAVMVKVEKWDRLALDAFRYVSKSLSSPALCIISHRRAAVGTDNNVFILGHNSNQLNGQQIENVVRRKHIVILYEDGIQTIDDQ